MRNLWKRMAMVVAVSMILLLLEPVVKLIKEKGTKKKYIARFEPGER